MTLTEPTGWVHPPSPDEAMLAQRTNAVGDVLSALRGAGSGLRALPGALRRVFKLRAWEEFQTPLGSLTRHTTFAAWVHADPPFGLGTSWEQLTNLIKDDVELVAAFDAATQRQDGNPSGANQHTVGTVDNVHGSSKPFDPPPEVLPPRPSGNAAQTVIRRLRKAVENGNAAAAALFADVAAGKISAHRAAINMGFRKEPTPLEIAKRSWRKMTAEEQQEFLAWIAN